MGIKTERAPHGFLVLLYLRCSFDVAFLLEACDAPYGMVLVCGPTDVLWGMQYAVCGSTRYVVRGKHTPWTDTVLTTSDPVASKQLQSKQRAYRCDT